MSGLMPDTMKPKLPDKELKPKKRRKNNIVVMFDREARAEYLTGFQKRKQERREKALAELELKTKQSKQEERKVRIGYCHIVGETDTYQFLHKNEGDIVVDNHMLKSFYQL